MLSEHSYTGNKAGSLNRIGGLGSSVAALLAQHYPTPLEYIAVNDSFGESGTPTQLMIKYGLDTVDITTSVKKVLSRKKNEMKPYFYVKEGLNIQ